MILTLGRYHLRTLTYPDPDRGKKQRTRKPYHLKVGQHHGDEGIPPLKACISYLTAKLLQLGGNTLFLFWLDAVLWKWLTFSQGLICVLDLGSVDDLLPLQNLGGESSSPQRDSCGSARLRGQSDSHQTAEEDLPK